MGTVTWDASKPARTRGAGAPTVYGEYHASGSHTSTTTASNLTDGAAGAGSAVSFPVGVILRVVTDEAGWLRLGGTAAALNAGFYLAADTPRDIEVSTAGTISIIDVA
jgi:hypothetical protein